MAVTEYIRTQSPVNLTLLTQEINNTVSGYTVDHLDFNAPNDLHVFMSDSMSAPQVTNMDTAITNHVGTAFKQRDKAKSNPTSSTTSTQWQEKLSFITSPLAVGDYKISWSAEVRKQNGSRACEARVRLDNSSDLAEVTAEPPIWTSFTGFDVVTFSTPGAHIIDVEYRIAQGGGQPGQGDIRRVTIEIEALNID